MYITFVVNSLLSIYFFYVTISLLHKYEISSLLPSSVAVQPDLCGTCSGTPKTGFLTTRLNYRTATVPNFKYKQNHDENRRYVSRYQIVTFSKCKHRVWLLVDGVYLQSVFGA